MSELKTNMDTTKPHFGFVDYSKSLYPVVRGTNVGRVRDEQGNRIEVFWQEGTRIHFQGDIKHIAFIYPVTHGDDFIEILEGVEHCELIRKLITLGVHDFDYEASRIRLEVLISKLVSTAEEAFTSNPVEETIIKDLSPYVEINRDHKFIDVSLIIDTDGSEKVFKLSVNQIVEALEKTNKSLMEVMKVARE